MHILINGSATDYNEENKFTLENFNKILKLSEEILLNDNKFIPKETTLIFCGSPGADLLNIYLAEKYEFNLECHFPCNYNLEENKFEKEGLMLEHNKFVVSTGIDSLKIINEFIKKKNPKIFNHNSNNNRNKKVGDLSDLILSFTWMDDQTFDKFLKEKNTKSGTVDTWLKSKNVPKHHYYINSSLNDNVQYKYETITRNLQEIIGEEEIMPILRKRNLNIYWGTAPTSSPSIGYLYPLLKIADLVDAGCNVTILIADLHAFLDNMKSPLERIKHRSLYYTEVLKSILKIYNVDLRKVQFKLGSEFQLSPEYTMDVYKYGNLTTINEAKHAGTEVVKQTDNPYMTSLLYPSLQSLDEEYLNVDASLAGLDQRKIITFSREYLPKLGYKKRIHLLNPIIPGLSTSKTNGEFVKMSSSDPKGKIDLTDSASDIKTKIKKAYCLEGDIDDNTPLQLIKNLVYKILKRFDRPFVINRPEKYGGDKIYYNYEDLQKDFQNKCLHPEDLKSGLANFFVQLLEPLRVKFNEKNYSEIKKLSYD